MEGIEAVTLRDPDTAFRRKMSEFGLYPEAILWDGCLHHFPGKGKAERYPSNKSGWYVAFDDRTGGFFGDSSQALEEVNWHIKRDRPPPRAEIEEWARLDRKAAKRQAKARKRAMEEVQAAWDAAVPANTANRHPYLEAKQIDRGIDKIRVLKAGTEGLKIMGEEFRIAQDMLLIPMRKNGKLVNVQRMIGDSERYWPEAQVVGTFCAVGAPHFFKKTRSKRPKTIYVCEGWATAWSISECMKVLCVAAFNSAGLLRLAQGIHKKHPQANIIIAADNERWSRLHDDTPNPGVWYAAQAAGEVGAAVAIPDFKDLTTQPTSFNDLHRLEGATAVRKWLDPENGHRAVTFPEFEEQHREPGPDGWVGSAPFRFLGVHNGNYFYLPFSHGQIVKLSASRHGHEMELAPLAGDDWWAQEFPDDAGNGVAWKKAGKALMRHNREVGIFQPQDIRGRGFWRDDGGDVIAHFGDRLLAPGAESFVRPESYTEQDAVIYTRGPRVGGSFREQIMSVTESGKLLEMFTSRAWDDEVSGHLLAGWVVIAPFSGALGWRPPRLAHGVERVRQDDDHPANGHPIARRHVALLEGLDHRGRDPACQLKDDALPVVLDDVEYADTGQARAKQVRG